MSLWLKMIGAHDFKLTPRPFEDWNRQEMREEVRFPRHLFPHQMTPGDEFIYYAVGYFRIFAQALLVGDVRRDVPHPNTEVRRRWPHAGPIKLGPHVEDLMLAPHLKDLNPDLYGQIHKGVSFLPMGRSEFDAAVAAIRRARAAEELANKRRERATT
jgi:hypothetical protein